MNIPIAYNKFRSHLFNSSDAAIKLVEKKPSDNNINFALKLLRAKMANAEKTLKRYPELSEDFEYSIKKYCRLSKKIISIKNVRDNQAQGLVENRTGAPTLYEPKQKDYSNKLLVGYDLARKDLRRCNFSDANFSPVDVIYRCSKPVNFSWSNLDGVDLSSAMLEGANFSNCSLAGAKICVNNANFTAAKLDDAVITLDLPSHWNSRRSERLLNDANKNNTIFDTIDSIDDTYADIKVKLMHQVIDSVFDNDHALQGSIPGIALLNSFVSKDIYQQDEKISKTIEALVRSEMLYANSKVSMDECSAKTLSLFLDKFSQSNDDMLKFNGAFIQLMTVCVNHNILSVKKQARDLYNRYLSLDAVKPYVDKFEFGNSEGKAYWGDKTNLNYILLNDQKAMIIDHVNISKMLQLSNDNNDVKWDHFYLYQNNECQPTGSINYKKTFIDDFKIFADSFIECNKGSRFSNLLATLELGSYKDQFTAVLSGESVTKKMKLVGIDDQLNLEKIFSKVLVKSDKNDKEPMLKPEHYEDIIDAFYLSDTSNKVKAQTLFSHATVFSKYSASSCFGTEYDSPQVLRNYAYALMSKANELNVDVAGENFSDWKARLLGLNDAFTCSDLIFGDASNWLNLMYNAGF